MLRVSARLALPAIVLVVGALVAVWWWHREPERPRAAATAAEVEFIGSTQCAECHASEHRAWMGSQHQLAMQHADDKTVLGDFDDATFRYGNLQSRFFRRDGQYRVRTDGPDGRLQDFEVRYVFGLAPLQQYLIELPGGRLQALSIAWDTRPRADGGQRWFHLHPGQNIRAGDPLHWTGLQQNWNFMCADCHSTNVRKNYDAASRTFRTTWSEISVGCEGCHGPGAAHRGWARKQGDWRRVANKGLTVTLDERRGIRWDPDPASGNAKRSTPLASNKEIEVCARCHARRAQLTDAVRAGDALADGFQMALLRPGLYHVDGQMRDEVYNYGSFLQSKMHANGVTCSDCHDPHTQKLRAPGNGMCAQCHSAEKYDQSAHHFHPTGAQSARCVACHMPTATYMVIDPRHDHSFRVPRPDLSERLNVPNACNACHTDKSARWAAAEIERRLGPQRKGYQRFAETFQAADRTSAGAAGGLIALIEDASQPAIVRASALERLGQQPGAPRIDTLTRGLNDADPLVREAAVAALAQVEPAARVRFLPRMLGDSARAVRIAAARSLVEVPAGQIPGEYRAALQQALAEYVAVQRYNGDRPEAQTALGSLFARQGHWDEAVRAFETAAALDPTFVPAYVNWADALRDRGREAEAEGVLRAGLKANGRDAALHHALGLSLVRQRRVAEGLAALALAAKRAPEVARYGYVYGVALHDLGRRADGVRTLEATLARHPNDPPTLFALAAYQREAGRADAAREYAERLVRITPDDENARSLLQALDGRR